MKAARHNLLRKTDPFIAGVLAPLLLAGAMYGTSKGVKAAWKDSKSAFHTAEVNAHEKYEADLLGNPGTPEQPPKQISPTDLVFHTVQAGEGSPTQVAKDMGAKDIVLVGDEIAAEVGGQFNMHVGDKVVAARDQLQPPKQ